MGYCFARFAKKNFAKTSGNFKLESLSFWLRYLQSLRLIIYNCFISMCLRMNLVLEIILNFANYLDLKQSIQKDCCKLTKILKTWKCGDICKLSSKLLSCFNVYYFFIKIPLILKVCNCLDKIGMIKSYFTKW